MKLRCMTCHLTVVKMLEIHMATTTVENGVDLFSRPKQQETGRDKFDKHRLLTKNLQLRHMTSC